MSVFDDTVCSLGEGPLWHPELKQLFWFDILGKRLLTRAGSSTRVFQFDECVSAAGWVSQSELLIASETRLFLFDLDSETQTDVAPLEADRPDTRSNDGRADSWGGFWIGTMAFDAAPGAGAIYRYYRGEVRRLYDKVSIPNAICFDPSGSYAVFADTDTGKIMRQPLAVADGWPDGEPTVWLDLSGEDFGVDGAVMDADGNFWNAQWGGWRVACYAPDGTLLKTVPFSAAHTSCPAFGGDDLATLFCTSALYMLSEADAKASADHGKTFFEEDVARGQAEHRVILG